MKKKRVLLVCAQPLLCEGLEAILGRLEDVELIGPWVLDAQILARLFQEGPDIVVIAGEGGDGSGPQLATQCLERCPDVPVIRIELAQIAVRLYTSRTLPAHSVDLIETIRQLPESR